MLIYCSHFSSPWRGIRLFVCFLVWFCWLGSQQPLLAQQANTCIQDAALAHGIKQLNCTANDVSVAQVSVLNNVTSCTAGQNVTLLLGLDLALNSQTRYDIGIFTALDGGDALTGMCAVSALPTTPNPPFFNGDADTCGDLDKAHSPLNSFQIQQVTVPCIADATGKLKLNASVSWDNNNKNVCNSTADIYPSTAAQCLGQAALPVNITVLNALTIVKDTQPDNAQDFTFTATGSGLQSFTLDDDTDNTWPNQRTFVNLANGQYVVSEDALAGWSLSSLRCVDSNNQSVGAINLTTRTATLNLQGSNVTCTFINQQTPPGKIVIKKQTTTATGSDAPSSGFAFDFALTGSTTNQNFTLTSGQQTTFTVAAGLFSLSETINDPVPGRWSQTAATCSDGSPLTAIDVASGETVTCTITNQYNFKHLTLTPLCPSGVFDLNNPNSYTVNYTWDTNGGAATGAGSAAQGQNIQAIVTGLPDVTVQLLVNGVQNDTQAALANCSTLTLIKTADPATGTDFTFNLSKSVALGSLPSLLVLDDASPDDGDNISNQATWTGLYPGVYTLTETLPTGWSQTGVSCTDNRGILTANDLSLTLTYNDDVTCTVANTLKRGKIIVVKATDPAEATQAFTFTTNYGPAFTLSDGQQNDSGSLLPGKYNATESILPGWSNTSATCDDGSDPSAIDLAAGETVTCTFTNTLQRGHIIVQKSTIPSGVTQVFTFTNDYGQPFTLQDQQHNDSGPLLPGIYQVDETQLPLGWSNTSATCDDGSDPSVIGLAAGETVTCTFVNTAQPAGINLIKSADQAQVAAGTQVTYAYTVTNQGQAPLSVLMLSDDFCTPVTYTSGDDGDAFLEVGEQWHYTCTSTLTQDTINTAIVTATTPLNTLITASQKAFVDVLPTLAASKAANVQSVPETGGTVQFTIVVTNTSSEVVILNTLNDSIFGDLDGQGDCLVPQVMASQAHYTCTFTKVLDGDAAGVHLNMVTARANDDEGNRAEAYAEATVSFGDVLPSVALSKNAEPSSRPEPGGLFTFTLTVHNTSAEVVNISDLQDTYPIGSQCNGLIGQLLDPDQTLSCQYTPTLTLPDTYTNTASVQVTDNEENTAEAQAQANVTVLDTPANIQVEKQAAALTLYEPGGNLAFTVQITNTSAVDAVTLETLVDDIDSDGINDVPYDPAKICSATTLQPGDVVTCTFTRFLLGTPGEILTDRLTVNALSDDEDSIQAADDASVVIIGLGSNVTMRKTPSQTTLPEPGGNVVFTVQITNTSLIDVVTINQFTDSVFSDLTSSGHDGLLSTTCTVPQTLAPNGATYTCTFTAQVTGNAGALHSNIAIASGVDDDGDQVTGVANAVVAFTDTPSAIQVTKQANPSSVPESGGNVVYTVQIQNSSAVDQVTINQVQDDRFGDLSADCLPELPALLAPQATITCTFTRFVQGNADATHRNTVTVTGVDDDGQSITGSSQATVTFTDLPAKLTVTKSATPTQVAESGGNVAFVVTVKNTSVIDAVTVQKVMDNRFGDVSAGCQPALPVTLQPQASLTCTFTRFLVGNAGTQHTNTVTVSGTDDDQQPVTGQANAIVRFTDLPSSLTLSKTPDRPGVPATGEVVTFTLQVKNTSAADHLTLNQWVDSIYGNIADQNNPLLRSTTCLPSLSLAPGELYNCQFAALVNGKVGDIHQNILTLSGVDDDQQPVTQQAQAQVVVADPIITATKADAILRDNNADGLIGPDDLIEYTVVIQNRGNASAHGVTFHDTPDPNSTLLVGTVTTDHGTITHGNKGGDSDIAVAVGELAPKATVTIRFQVQVKNPLPQQIQKLKNQATITGDNFTATVTDDPKTPTSLDETVTPVIAAPQLTAIKSARLVNDNDSNKAISPGDTLEYRITVVNNGNQAALATLVDDTLDVNTRLVVGSVATSQGQVTGGNQANATAVSVDLGVLNGNGSAAVITFRVTINKPLPEGVIRVANQAVISSSNHISILTDDPGTTIVGDPTITPVVTKPSALEETAEPGRSFLYLPWMQR